MKLATGDGCIVSAMDTESVHMPLVTTNFTVFIPAELKMTPVGFSMVDVAGVAPGPKSQAKLRPPPVDPVLRKSTGAPAHAGALVVKLAKGLAIT